MRPMATKPKMEPHLFCIGSNRESIPSLEIASNMNSNHDYNSVLESINYNRVTIVAAIKGFGKSTVIPKLIVQDYSLKQKNCKVVVVGTHRTTAITNSETVAGAINQKIGNTVGFQVRLESQTNEYSNLIYTTSIFFLRCLMGRHPKEALQKITHIIIDDCQEHNPYSDITMFEIKDVLIFLPQLRVILLTTPDYSLPLKDYFGEGNIICFPGQIENIPKYHLEEILENFNIDIDVLVPTLEKQTRQLDPEVHMNIDKLLDDYMVTGSDQSFNVFIYSLETHEISVDIQHSVKKTTALMCAAFNNRLDHVEALLFKKRANARLVDSNYKTAVVYANSRRFFECSQFINNCLHEKELLELSSTYKTCYYEDYRAEMEGMHVDFKLICELIKWIFSTYKNVDQTIVVVYLPSYEFILRMHYHILLEKILGSVPHDLEINLVHDDIQKDQLAKLKAEKFKKTVVLTTSILESVIKISNITFIIDSGKVCREVCIPEIRDNELEIQWISKARANRRCVSGVKSVFRLYSKHQYSNMPAICQPDLKIMPLDRVAMFAKQLQPYKRAVDYFTDMIAPPPVQNIEAVMNILQSSGVFTENEDMTWLGVRLLDVHVDVRLGKMLVYGIVLQCLDPVLTLVASLSCSDPLEIPVNGTFTDHNDIIREKINKKRQSLCKSFLSDHLMAIKLYNEWQDKHDMSSTDYPLADEVTFLQNGILEKICGMRAYIVGSLRSAKLVHKIGPLNMTSLNQRSNSWSTVKACIIGGMYPNCCQIDIEAANITYKIKSGNDKNIVISTNSSLITNYPQAPEDQPRPALENIKFFVYHKSKKTSLADYQCVDRITAVTPVSMILFSGESNLGRFAFSMQRTLNNFPNFITTTSWLNFVADNGDTELLYDLRCKFYNVFFDIIQTCHNNDKWERSSKNSNNNHHHHDVISTVEKVLAIEEHAYNFATPSNIGDRPRAFSHKFALAATTAFTESERKFIDVDKILSYFGYSKSVVSKEDRKRTFYVYRVEQKSNCLSHIQSFNHGHSLNFTSQMANFIVQFLFKDLNQFAFLLFYAAKEKQFVKVCEMFSEKQDSKSVIYFEELMKISFKADDFEKLWKQNFDYFDKHIIEIEPKVGEEFLRQCAFKTPSF
ncbi:YTHDC2.2 family protein [Megaselia abdita]